MPWRTCRKETKRDTPRATLARYVDIATVRCGARTQLREPVLGSCWRKYSANRSAPDAGMGHKAHAHIASRQQSPSPWVVARLHIQNTTRSNCTSPLTLRFKTVRVAVEHIRCPTAFFQACHILSRHRGHGATAQLALHCRQNRWQSQEYTRNSARMGTSADSRLAALGVTRSTVSSCRNVSRHR